MLDLSYLNRVHAGTTRTLGIFKTLPSQTLMVNPLQEHALG